MDARLSRRGSVASLEAAAAGSGSMGRRQFLGLLGALGLLSGCGNRSAVGPAETERFDGVLAGNAEDLGAALAQQLPGIRTLAQRPGTEMLLGLEDTSGQLQALGVSVQASGPVGYLHPVLRRGDDARAHLVFGWSGLVPTLELVDEGGRAMAPGGKLVAAGRGALGAETATPALDLDSFLQRGLQISALALAVWLGAKVLGAVVAAVAFVSFNALLVGVILSAAGALEPALAWVLNQLGLTMDDLRAYFERGAEVLGQLVQQLEQAIRAGYAVG